MCGSEDFRLGICVGKLSKNYRLIFSAAYVSIFHTQLVEIYHFDFFPQADRPADRQTNPQTLLLIEYPARSFIRLNSQRGIEVSRFSSQVITYAA